MLSCDGAGEGVDDGAGDGAVLLELHGEAGGLHLLELCTRVAGDEEAALAAIEDVVEAAVGGLK